MLNVIRYKVSQIQNVKNSNGIWFLHQTDRRTKRRMRRGEVERRKVGGGEGRRREEEEEGEGEGEGEEKLS